MARVRASNERWARNRQQLDLEFRRIERESARQAESDRLLERLGDLVAQMLCPKFEGGAGQHEKRTENDRSESTA
jgi:cell division protein FtsL